MLLILFVAPRYHTNQIPIVEGLMKEGYNVRILAMYKGVSENYEALQPDILLPSLTVKMRYNRILRKNGEVYAENWMIRHYVPEYIKALKYLKNLNPDIVILRERSKQSRVIYACCKILGIRKVILYNQQPLCSEWRGKAWKKHLASIVFPKIRYTPVKYVKLLSKPDNYELVHSKKHTYFLPFVQNICTLPNKKKYLENGIIRILDVGKYRDYKNHSILIEAITMMKHRKNINITIVGQVSNKDEQEYYNNLSDMIQNKNLQDTVSLKRNIPYYEMKNLYAENDIFVLPSKEEIASISVLEAMANGLCVISTDNNGTAFYVLEGNAGMNFDYTSSQDLADKLSYLVENPEKIRYFGQNALEYIENNCSFKNYLEGLKCILKKEFNFYM
jgi:glycosyltransferase involved in cell wall biosynthesis